MGGGRQGRARIGKNYPVVLRNRTETRQLIESSACGWVLGAEIVIEVLGKIGETGHARHEHPVRRETREVLQAREPVDVGSEANDVIPFYPRDRVGELRAGFVKAVVGSEIVS